MKIVQLRWLTISLMCSVAPLEAAVIQVKGLFSDAALISIDGETQLLRVGSHADAVHGIELVAASSREATLRWQGQTRQLTLNEWWGDAFQRRPRGDINARTLILKQPDGVFVAAGAINDHPVRFEWSPESNDIALGSLVAHRLGLPASNTASALAVVGHGSLKGSDTPVSRVKLDRVAIGSVVVRDVEAVLVAGLATDHVLLGRALANYFRIKQHPAHLELEIR